MKTYKHNNSELISEQTLELLHKNSKTIRIKKKAAEKRKFIFDLIGGTLSITILLALVIEILHYLSI